MTRGANATTSAAAAKAAARSASPALDTPHRRPAEESRRPDEEDHEDHGEPAYEPHVAAERRPVRAEQVQEDTEREAAHHGARRTGQAAEHRGRECVQQDALHHVRV